MKILLLGANGQLGREFLAQGGLAARGEIVAATRDGLLADGGTGIAVDLASSEALLSLLDREEPSVIVNAAAYTAVDRAEQESSLAMRVNGEALRVIGSWAASHDALVVHYSTDYVFPGDGVSAYREGDAVGPTGVYGLSKLAGEVALRDSGARHFIFRTAWVYSPVGHNFLRTMLRLGAERDELAVVSDQQGTPTDTTLIVEGSLKALDRWLTSATDRAAIEGTYHLTASGSTTWHGFATALLAGAAERGLLPRAPTVRAIGTADFPTPARRPAYSVLDNHHFAGTFGLDLPPWQVGMERTLNALSQSSD